MTKLNLSEDVLNHDWTKLLRDGEYVEKHLAGQHDQKLHTPKKYGRGGPVGLNPNSERQARWKAMLDDPEMSMYHTNEAIREEIDALPGGPEALHQLEKWYYNPGNPDELMYNDAVYAEYQSALDSGEIDDGYQFEDYLADQAEIEGWDPEGDHALLDALRSVKGGTADPEQVEAMSAIYDYTQAHIQHRGIGSFPVHRGLALEPEDAAQLKEGRKVGTAIAGHWSAKEDVSEKFAAGVYDPVPVESRPETTEVIIHKTFEPEEVFNYHLAHADKFEDYYKGLYEENEVVPVDGTEHEIVKVESKPSRFSDQETLHVWVK